MGGDKTTVGTGEDDSVACERHLCIDEIRRLNGIPAIVNLISLPAPNHTTQTSKRGKRSAIEMIAVLSEDARNSVIICEHKGVRSTTFQLR